MLFLAENDRLLAYEYEKWDKGFFCVAGVDEAGRGPLAGPVVAAAVIFPAKCRTIPTVDDSKKLSRQRRNDLYEQLLAVEGIRFAIHEVSASEIDRINILRASQLAMIRAVNDLKPVDFVLIDGLPIKEFPFPSLAIVKGDSKSASIAAASILAKVYRDNLMEEYAKSYPGYGFDTHKGYGTAAHLDALKNLGTVAIHRKSFAPVRKILNPPPEQMELL